MVDESDVVDVLTVQHLIEGLRWLDKVSVESMWSLTESEKLALLGNISATEFSSLHALPDNHALDTLNINVLERLVLLIRITKCISVLLGQNHCYEALKRKNLNPVFNSLSIKDFLLNSQSVESYYIALRYLENAIYQ